MSGTTGAGWTAAGGVTTTGGGGVTGRGGRKIINTRAATKSAEPTRSHLDLFMAIKNYWENRANRQEAKANETTGETKRDPWF
jgi:hypothetical protein